MAAAYGPGRVTVRANVWLRRFFVLALLMITSISSARGADRFSTLRDLAAVSSMPFLQWSGGVAKNDMARRVVSICRAGRLSTGARAMVSAGFGWVRLAGTSFG